MPGNNPRFQNGDEVIALSDLRRVKNSWLTVGGVRIYSLEGDYRLWEERLLAPVPGMPGRPAAPPAPAREPGEDE